MVNIPVSEHILLRTYAPEDAGELFQVIDRNRQHLRAWLPWVDATTKPLHTLDFIVDAARKLHNQEGLALGIVYNNTIIGGLGMHRWDHQLKKANIGYWVSKDYEGKGIVTSCLTSFINFLFDKLNLNKVEIEFVVNNQRSAEVAARLGARIEGVLRDSYLANGMYQDLVIAGILKKEWQPAK